MSSSGNKPNLELMNYRLEQVEKAVEELKKKDEKFSNELSGRDSKKLALWVGAFMTVSTGAILYIVQMLIANLGGK